MRRAFLFFISRFYLVAHRLLRLPHPRKSEMNHPSILLSPSYSRLGVVFWEMSARLSTQFAVA